MASQIDTDIPLEPVKPGMSYDELRQRNREEYARKQREIMQPYKSNVGSSTPQAIPESGTNVPPSMSSSDSQGYQSSYRRKPYSNESVKSERTNKYGDIISD